jgi:catechol 2,3-dioxygenase-like lactoylglutathione lyase family enzyme
VSELSSAELVAFVAVTDAARARAFYEGVLELPVLAEDGVAVTVDAHGTRVRLTPVSLQAPPA